jgi:hypothetical protein
MCLKHEFLTSLLQYLSRKLSNECDMLLGGNKKKKKKKKIDDTTFQVIVVHSGDDVSDQWLNELNS